MRILSRFFKVGKYLFTVRCNPLKRKIFAINEVIQDTHDAKIIVGLLTGFLKYGLINTFTATELTGSKELLARADGIVTFPEIKKLLNPVELKTFQNDVDSIKTQKVNTPTKQT
jgi:hypothetical protein